MKKHIKTVIGILVLWAATSTPVTAADRITDLRDIIKFADRMTGRSVCFGAGCVRMSCEDAPETWRALSTALWSVGEIDGSLVEMRDKEMTGAIAHMENAGRDQDRADFVTDIQLVQDSISVVYVAASEIASILDIKQSLAKNADEWKKVFSGESPLDKFAVLKDLKSLASRANTFSKYTSIGSDKKQDVPWADIAKAAAEGRLRYEELVRKKAEGSLTTQDQRKAWLSQLKELGDIALKMDRWARQSRIADYQRGAMAALGAAQKAADRMAEINETRRLAADAQIALNRTIRAYFICYSAACRISATPAPQLESIKPTLVDDTLGLGRRIKEYDQRLRTARDALVVAAQAYAPIVDVTSRLSIQRRTTRYDEDVVASHAISKFRIGEGIKQCIPDNAWLTVVAGKNRGYGESIMDVAPADPSPGNATFKVQEDLAGTWQSSDSSLEIEIGTINETVVITRKNTPVEGRDRVYTGNLVRQFSQPGDYTLALRDTEGKSYLPVHFTVEGPDTLVENTLTAYSNPSEIADISPAVPEDIRTKLLGEAYRNKIRYRAEMDLELNPGGATELHLTLYNHKLRFGTTSREIAADSIEDKLSIDTRLTRVSAAQDQH
ncbi:MAG: hypothetical protein ABJN26_25765 [Stappiaceae bacterium]